MLRRRAPRRWLSAALCLVMAAATAAVAVPAAGAQSAASGTVVIANGWSSADSAVASALAALEGSGSSSAAVLYATTGELTSRTAGFIADRKPSKVILVGGTKALSTAVAAEVEGLTGAAPTRISGADRFDTAAKAVPSTATTFVVANGYSAADTGVAAALAAVTRNAGVLLATADSLTTATEQVIRERQPSQVIFVGGTAVLGTALADRVRELAPGVTSVPRHSGSSRTHTAAAAAPSTATTVVIANGWSAADSGVAAALAATTGNAAVLYARATSLTSPTVNRISELQPRAVVLVGGTSALGSLLIGSIHCTAPEATISRVSGSDRIDTAVRAASGDQTRLNTNYDCGGGGNVGTGGGGGSPGTGGGGSPGTGGGTGTNVQVPTAPSKLRATSVNKALELSWTAPSTGVVTTYSIQYRTQDTDSQQSGNQPGDWVNASTTTTGTTFTVNGPVISSGPFAGDPTTVPSLTNGTSYELRVRAHNGGGAGPWSPLAAGTPEGKPSQPTSVQVTPAHQGLEVQWQAPSSDGGESIVDYDVQYRACTATPLTCATSPSWGDWTDRTGETGSDTAMTVSISGLANGTAYQVQVRADNTIGESDWSAAASAVPSAVPDAPTPFALTRGDRKIDASWGKCWTVSYSGDSTYYVYEAWVLDTSLTNQDDCEYEGEHIPNEWQPFAPPRPKTGCWADWQHNDVTITICTTVYGWGGYQAVWVPAPTGQTASRLTITDFDVRYRSCSADCSGSNATWGSWVNRTGETSSDTTASASLTSLTNGTKYQVQVRAQNSVGESPWSSATATPAGVPKTPTGLQVEITSATSLKASWTAADGNGAAITDYDVRYCTDSTGCDAADEWTESNSSNTSTATSAAITGLTAGTRYRVQVRAGNAMGDGAWSSSTLGTPDAVPAAPSAPTVTVSSQQLGISWTPPNSGGSAITDYDVQYRACSATPKSCTTNPAWGIWRSHSHTGTATSATITGLTNGTAYQVQVRATNSVGTGAWSPSPSTDAIPAGPPLGAPTNLTTTRGDAMLSVAWTAPSSDNGSPITGYEVSYCGITDTQNCSDTATWTEAGGSASTSTVLNSLTNGTTYRWRVQAQNAIGDGPWSSVASGKPATTPSAPRQSTDGIIGNDRSLKATWGAPESDGGEAVTDYDVQYRITDTDSGQSGDQPGPWKDHSHTGTLRTATITGLTNDVEYDVQARATNSIGSSSWSDLGSAQAGGAPLAPTAPTVTSGDAKLSVSWSAPGANGGGDITGYAVEYRIRDTDETSTGNQPGQWRSDSPSGNVLSHDVTGNGGLTNGTVYEVRVAAANARGTGAWSPPTSGTPATAPSAPGSVTAAGANDSVTVSWSTPAANGSTVTGFRVRHCTNDTSCADEDNDVLGTANVSGASIRGYTITGLTNGTSYDVQVQTVGSIHGDSAWSTTATAAAGGPPSAPTGLTATAGNASIALTWTTPTDTGGWVISGYTVQYCDSSTGCDVDSEWTNAVTSHNTTSYTIASLNNGTTYRVRVNASNSARGAGPWSATVTAKPASTPKALDQVTLRSGNASLRVGWSVDDLNWTNGSTVTGFEVRYCDTGGDIDCATSSTYDTGWSKATVSGSAARSTTVSGLNNGNGYQVVVRVTSSDQGSSAWKAWSQTGDLPGSNTPGAPSQVSGLSLSVSGSALKASWTAATGNGEDVSGYELQYCNVTDHGDCNHPDNVQHWADDSPSGTGTEHTLSDYFDTGDKIKVRVRASNGFGNGPWLTSAQGTWP